MKNCTSKSTLMNEKIQLNFINDNSKSLTDDLLFNIVRGEFSYHDMKLLYHRHSSVCSCSSICSRSHSCHVLVMFSQSHSGSFPDNTFWHFRSRGRPRGQHGMPTCAPVLPAVYRAPLPQFSAFILRFIYRFTFIQEF